MSHVRSLMEYIYTERERECARKYHYGKTFTAQIYPTPIKLFSGLEENNNEFKSKLRTQMVKLEKEKLIITFEHYSPPN